MFQPSIDVIRAVQSDRISRDVIARARPEVARNGDSESAVRAIRRSIGRRVVRFGERIASDVPTEPTFGPAR